MERIELKVDPSVAAAEAVDDMISRCRRGPDHARVEVLDRREETEMPPPGFQIRVGE